MSDAAPEKKEGEAEAAPKSKKKLFIIIGVALVAILGVVGFLMMGGKKEAPKEEKPVEEEKHFETAQLPVIIVNLSDSTSFLKVGLLLEYDATLLAKGSGNLGGGKGGGHGGGGDAAPKGGLPGVMGKREPMIKDAIIRVLSSKRADELLLVEGKEKLKEELIEAINEATGLEEGPVVQIYFTEFIIQ